MGEFASKGVAGAGLGTGKLYIDGLNYFADEVDLERLYNLIKTA